MKGIEVAIPHNFMTDRGVLFPEKNKDEFPLFGLNVFCGRQGSGKTYLMMYSLFRIKRKYPLVKIYTNVALQGLDYVPFRTKKQLEGLLQTINDGKTGSIIVVDELQAYFNALESADVAPAVAGAIAQLRKRHILLLGTSQLFGRFSKVFREQCYRVVACRTWLGRITFGSMYEGETLSIDSDTQKWTGERAGGILPKIVLQSSKIRGSYDTWQLLKRE